MDPLHVRQGATGHWLVCIITVLCCFLSIDQGAASQIALWPLTDKHDNPVKDLSGNGHDGVIHNVEPYGEHFPGTDTRGYRFFGNSESYVEIPNDGSLSVNDFTVVVYLFRETDVQAQIFSWDPAGLWGSHLWTFDGQRLFFRPIYSDGNFLPFVIRSGLRVNEWVRALLSFNTNTGIVKLCVEDDCSEHSVSATNIAHKTDAAITLGVHRGIWDTRYYQGNMACLALYDKYYEDISEIPFAEMQNKCFHFNDMCQLDKDTGEGSENIPSFYFDKESRECKPFEYKGSGGNDNRFTSVADCELECAAFIPPEPTAIWPLTNKYDDPMKDISGNGHDGQIFNLEPSGLYFPGTDTRAYRFDGTADSYAEIPNDGLDPTSFTIVMYVYREDDNWGVLFAWDPQSIYGTHIWSAGSQQFFVRPTNEAGGLFSGAYQSGLNTRQWVRVVVSYNYETGFVKTCSDDNCLEQNLYTAFQFHNTKDVIHLGSNKGVLDYMYFKGEMACLTFYEEYFEDINLIPFKKLREKCFDVNEFCKDGKDEGTGSSSVRRFFFNMETRECEQFDYNGNGGNKNNFKNKDECEKRCETFVPGEPTAFWPLTDKYDNPVRDISGNGNDGEMFELAPYGKPFPGTDTKGYRFIGSADSYVEIPNSDSLSPKSFTIVVYLFRENDNQAPIFSWDPQGAWGTHFWAFDSQRMYFRPMRPDSQTFPETYQNGLKVNEWVRAVVSFNAEAGLSKLCAEDECVENFIGLQNSEHYVDSVIRLGVNKGGPDSRYYQGEMACLTYYDRYFHDIDAIPFRKLQKECFHFNEMCLLEKDSGHGSEDKSRFYFDMVSRSCVSFKYKGQGGNDNRFTSKRICEEECSAFIPPDPEALWPLTNKYDDPVRDISGNGHDGQMFNLGESGLFFPGTDTRAYRFAGNADSFVEIPNEGLDPTSFTIVVYVYREDDNWGVLFAWDPQSIYGTHIWSAGSQQFFVRPTTETGGLYTGAYQSGLNTRQWVRVVVSYNYETGFVKTCSDDDCLEQNLYTAFQFHNTKDVIHLGSNKGVLDYMYFKGEMACLTFYDEYFEDISLIPFEKLREKCFDVNEFCKDGKDEGTGSSSVKRFFFNLETRECEQFDYNGNGGNKNNFKNKNECEQQCKAFIPDEPTAFWPLTDKYDNPVRDISGNGNDGEMFNLAPYGKPFPGTATRGYRFSGTADSYVEIPNDGALSPMSFTVAVYLYRENDQAGPIFAWDPSGIYGTHLWASQNQVLYFLPTQLSTGASFGETTQTNLLVKEWVRVIVSYNAEAGIAKLCVEDECIENFMNTAFQEHETDALIRLGVSKGAGDNRFYQGEMACLTYYDRYFDDTDIIPFKKLQKKCFDFNDMCLLDKRNGTGQDSNTRYYFNRESKSCEEFEFTGKEGNANNFLSKQECEEICAAFIPRGPVALWPLTDKYENPVADLTGNGHDGTMFELEPYGTPFPDTATRGYRFDYYKKSFVEVPNNDLQATSFTVVVYVYYEDNYPGIIFAWDPPRRLGSYIWISDNNIYGSITDATGNVISAASQSGVTYRNWIRVVASYNFDTGFFKLCVGETCGDTDLYTSSDYHATDGPIRFGTSEGVANNNMNFVGQMACMTFYDQYFEDITAIDFEGLKNKCFDRNDFCLLEKSNGNGDDQSTRFYFDKESRECAQFEFTGGEGNENNFPSKEECLKFCSMFGPPQLLGHWPLTDKYENPFADISGNGPDAIGNKLAAGLEFVPETGSRAYHFAGTKDSYLEIPNEGLNPVDFTIVMWLKNEAGGWSPILNWDYDGQKGDNLWVAGDNTYFALMKHDGSTFQATYQSGLRLNQWVRVVVSYKMETGEVQTCNNDQCTKTQLNSAGFYHKNEAVIRLGVNLGVNDNSVYMGEMACVALYGGYFEDVEQIDYDNLFEKCFDYNGFCKLPKDEGTGDDTTFRFHFDTKSGKCVEFIYNGNDGNENNFNSIQECEETCHNYLTPQPLALWPLTNRYPDPAKDIAGNGHDGKLTGTLSGSDYENSHAISTQFTGTAASYMEVPNIGLETQEFTFVAYIHRNDDLWGTILTWGTEGKEGTAIMKAPGSQIYMRPVSKEGVRLKDVYHHGLAHEFARIIVAYSAPHGRVNMCINDHCTETHLGTEGIEIETDTDIRIGAPHHDGDFLSSDLACVSLFDSYITDLTEIKFEDLEETCFGNNSLSYCTCSGDPHCVSFDKMPNFFQGLCTYTMARDNCQEGMPVGPPTFEVLTNNHMLNFRASEVREVIVRLHKYDLEIHIFAGFGTTVNGQELLASPFTPNDDVIVNINPTHVFVIVKDLLIVKYDGVSTVVVKIDSSLIGQVCGICGNANGDSSDDWMVGPSDLCMKNFPYARPGQVTGDFNEFGSSWTAMLTDDVGCNHFCPRPPPPPGCDTVTHELAVEHCKILKDLDGPFGECLAKMPVGRRNEGFDNCVFDACILMTYDTIVCTFATTTATTCAEEFNLKLTWRTEDFCPMACPDTMIFKTCGNPCLPTCTDPNGENCGTDPDAPCEEGCFCEPHMIYDGIRCVSRETCGCLVPDDGVVIAVGDSFVSQDCSQECSCDEAGGELNCRDMTCKQNEVCILQEGVRGCFCNEPFKLVDGECLPESHVCELRLDRGYGVDKVNRFYYNSDKDMCKGFVYKGEGGNGNRFNTMEDCVALCGAGGKPVPDDCLAPKDSGEFCDGDNRQKTVFKYYFSSNTALCKKFRYKGCGGNTNLFNSKRACSKKCKGK